MRKAHKSIQLFKSPLMEKFTHVHPLTPLIVWSPIFCWFVWQTFEVLRLPFLKASMMGFAGFMTWTLVEYVLHRYIFHFEMESKIGQRIHFLIHGIHHDDPLDPTRLVLPPILSLTMGFGLFCIFRLVVGPIWIMPFFALFIVGYLSYDYIHFYVHHFIPGSRVGKYLKQSHMVHHYVDPNTRWGVSNPVWDLVFGTYDSLKGKETTVRPTANPSASS